MATAGIGVDMLEIARMERVLTRRPNFARRVFTDEERGWARLLELYLTTPINDRSELPRTPAELG